ncbi:MerR family transcriptional regulator [Chloroflexota bacterium]
MLKIGDFSRLSRVTVKALRYYDEIGLLKPAMVDRFNGYRYYSVDQLPRLNRIVVLKNLGLSLDEVAQLVSDNLSAAHIRQLLHVKQAEIRQRLSDENQRLGQVEEWLKQIEKEGIMPAKDVVIKKIEAQTIASARGVVPTYSDIGQLFNELYPHLGQHQAQIIGPPIAIYHDMEFKERDPDIEVAAPIIGAVPETGRVKVRQLEAIDTAACLIHQGPYEAISESYQALMAWAETNGYRIAGPDREIYIKSMNETTNPAEFITELQLPVEKK